jgi:hypothetical protein
MAAESSIPGNRPHEQTLDYLLRFAQMDVALRLVDDVEHHERQFDYSRSHTVSTYGNQTIRSAIGQKNQDSVFQASRMLWPIEAAARLHPEYEQYDRPIGPDLPPSS